MGIEVRSEGRVKITQDKIAAAVKRQGTGVRIIIRDSEEKGLALILNPTSRAWVFAYRPRGIDPASGHRWPNKTITLGNPSSLSIEDARRAAAAMKGQAAVGDDPHAIRKAKLAKAAKERAATVGRLADDYEAALPVRPKLRGSGLPSASHVSDEIAHVRAAIATMEVADTPASAVNGTHLRRMLAAEAARPATSRARFGAFSRFMDWAHEEGMVQINPCSTISKARRPRGAQSRAHYLTLDQLALLWKAAEKLDPLYRDLTRFLIALPCRRGEAAAVEWSHVDLKNASWSQPGAITKNGENHRLHLHPLLLPILAARHKEAGKPSAGLIFPAPRSKKAVDTFTSIKVDLDKETGLTGWRWHDFRRSFASVLGEAGLAEPVLDACLNHRQSATRSGVMGVYQRASRWPEQVAALKAWGVALDAAITGKAPDSNVVQLQAAS